MEIVESLGIINLKGPDSRNSRKRHSRTPLRGEPMSKPVFCFKKNTIILKKKAIFYA